MSADHGNRITRLGQREHDTCSCGQPWTNLVLPPYGEGNNGRAISGQEILALWLAPT